MEGSEHSLIPEWLKGASGSSQISPQPTFFREDGNSRSRTIQQLSGSYFDNGGSVSSDRSLYLLGHCSNSNSALEKFTGARENHTQGRSHSSFTHGDSSKRSYATHGREKEWDIHRADPACGKGWLPDGERSTWPKGLDISVTVSDNRKGEKDNSENGKVWLSIPAKPGSFDSEAQLWQSQSSGLSLRLPDINVREMEGVSTSIPIPSASGGLATNVPKAVFERNFPSLGLDDKIGGLVVSSGSSPIPSQCPLWQSPSWSDVGRASSPGLPEGFGGPPITPSSTNGAHGGGNIWNSVLAEVPVSNGNMQNVSLGNASPSCAVLNMAEALSQVPARVRHTPPQSAAESLRLEELALKQSRQLIPMTPSLPKTMSLNDKAKAKAIRPVDGPGSSGKSNPLPQSNSFSRSSSLPRGDTLKHSQGKLLVLKASKDGASLSTTAMKSEGSNPTPSIMHESIGGAGTTSSTTGLSIPGHTGVIGQSRRSLDHKGALQPGNGSVDVTTGLSIKDVIEDKRPSTEAQNRSDFFNALRKKAASNGSSSGILKSDSPEVESVVLVSSEGAMPATPGIPDQSFELEVRILSAAAECILQTHGNGENGDSVYSQREESMLQEKVCTENNTSAIICFEERLSADSEEEEAAFMRSLGWEENAEGSELTEEEINAFYQMREQRKLLNGRNHPDSFVEPCPHSSIIFPPSMPSSESDLDD